MDGNFKKLRMNKKYLLPILLVFCLFLFFSFVAMKKADRVCVEILNMDTITNGTIVEFKITNNSSKNYCFLIDTVAYKLKTPYPLDRYIMLNDIFNLYNKKNEEVIFELQDQFCNSNEEIVAHNKKINYKKTINNLIKVKSKSSFTYKLRFNSNVFYNNYCWGKYILDEKSNYFLRLDIKYYDKFLDKKQKDSICKSGYKLYTKKLTSQKVPFKLK